MNSEWRARYELARSAAHAAGNFALTHFQPGIEVEWKEDQSPVTVADRGAGQLLRETLLKQFPGDGFLGEESGTAASSTGFRWIIDPIDGTRNFVRGIPLWATLVGLEYQDEPIAGVAYLPGMKQTYRALRGDGAFRDDKRLHVSNVQELDKAHLFYSSLSWFERYHCDQAFLRLVKRVERTRGFGDFYGFVLVAEGAGEIMIEHGVHPWDLGALVPILEEAGGRITGWHGRRDIHRPDVLATNGILHDEVLRILNDPLAGSH